MTSKPARGFAGMSPERQREIASLGGRIARRIAHEFTSDEAREAGRKGGAAVSADREHMAKIGRRGSQRRWQKEHKRNVEALR